MLFHPKSKSQKAVIFFSRLQTALDSNNLFKTVFNSVCCSFFFGVPSNVNRNDNNAKAKQNNKQKQKTKRNETKQNTKSELLRSVSDLIPPYSNSTVISYEFLSPFLRSISFLHVFTSLNSNALFQNTHENKSSFFLQNINGTGIFMRFVVRTCR